MVAMKRAADRLPNTRDELERAIQRAERGLAAASAEGFREVLLRVRQAVRQSDLLRVRQAVRQSERLVVVLDRLVLQGLQGFRCCTPEASQATIDQHGLEAAACVRLDDVLGGPGRYAYVERLRTLGVRRLPVVRCAFAVCRRYGSVVVGVAGVPGFRGGFSPTASSYCLSACASVVAFGRPECSDRSARSCCARLHGRPGVFRGGPPEGALLEPQHLLAYEFLDLPPRPARARQRRGVVARLEAWLDGQPLDDRTLAAYLDSLREAGRAQATAAIVVAAVRHAARDAGRSQPDGPLTRQTIESFRRSRRSRRSLSPPQPRARPHR